MSTNQDLLKSKQNKAKLELKLARARSNERKKDVHNKIQLGGLIIKSKMDKYSKSIILGALISAFENIDNDPKYIDLFKYKGEKAFLNNE